MSHNLDTLSSPSPESLRPSTKRTHVEFSRGEEEMFIRSLEEVDRIELKKLLHFHREEALNTGKKLVVAFTAAATGFVDISDDGHADGTIYMSGSDSSLGDLEEESVYDTEDVSSVDEDRSNSDDDECRYTQIYDDDDDDTATDDGTTNGGASTDDGDDSTFEFGSDELSDCSSVDDGKILVGNFHELMKKLLDHNYASCLVQFMLNKLDGRLSDGPSLIQAMLPWAISLEDSAEADTLLGF